MDTTTTLADQRVASLLAPFFFELLGERGLRGGFHRLPLVRRHYAGNGTGQASLSHKVPVIGWGGVQRLATRTEGSGGSAIAITDASATVVLGPCFFAYEQSQEAGATDIYRLLDPANAPGLVAEMLAKYDMRVLELIAGLASGYTGNLVNRTGLAMSLDDIFDAQALLDADQVEGEMLLICNNGPNGWNNVLEQLRKEAGTIWSNDPDTLARQAAMGNYKGRLGKIDVITSTLLPTTGGDTFSCLYGNGSFAWADAMPFTNGANPYIPLDAGQTEPGRLLLSFDRSELDGGNLTAFHGLIGAVELQDNAGCAIRCLT